MRASTGPSARDLDIAPEPPGSLMIVAKKDEVVVWLIGDIDINLSLELHDVAVEAPRVASRLVLDGSRVTFCDSTLLRFISIVCGSMPVAVRRPSRVFADILAFSGLTRRVTILGAETGPR
jgi:hypothetical protein